MLCFDGTTNEFDKDVRAFSVAVGIWRSTATTDGGCTEHERRQVLLDVEERY